MAMLKRAISIGRSGGGLSYRSLSSGKSKSLHHVDTLGMVKALEAINVPSTQAEAITGAFTSGLESVMEKVKSDIAKSEEYQSTRIAEEVRMLRADIATMQADRRCDHDILIHKVDQGFTQLKYEFQASHYGVLKVAICTIASVTATGACIVFLL
ncbi:uncharacterized protein LOC17888667 [Capsella rubella]|uniref:uncharacterized protein LOC17888667 n=1 Tax=Capsella rubella TaxID=81985 RepID=UPI000CD56C4D|nr:uncharacterized protein LOC17888667 [Capsella rubella]